jgi:hypothetical protein
MTLEQAKDRIEVVAKRAVNAAVNMAIRIKKLRSVRSNLEIRETIVD